MKKLNLSKKQKNHLTRILIALAAFLIVLIVDKTVNLAGATGSKFGWLLPFCLYFAIYIVIGYDVLFKAARNIAHGQILDDEIHSPEEECREIEKVTSERIRAAARAYTLDTVYTLCSPDFDGTADSDEREDTE